MGSPDYVSRMFSCVCVFLPAYCPIGEGHLFRISYSELDRARGRGKGVVCRVRDQHKLTDVNSALYVRGDPYETSDAVFGVKQSLIIDIDKVDPATAKEYDFPEGGLLLKHDFVLTTKEETEKLRDENAVKALAQLGLQMKLVDHLPIPDLD